MWGSEVICCLFYEVKFRPALSHVSMLFMATWIKAAVSFCAGVIFFLGYLPWNGTKYQAFCDDASSECSLNKCVCVAIGEARAASM